MKSFEQPFDQFTMADMAFGVRRTLDYVPALDAIPEDFRRDRGDARPWLKFQADWFFSGLRDLQTVPRPGIDPKAAMNHLHVVQSSFDLSHEHKAAAVAYLASLWFESVPTYEKAR